MKLACKIGWCHLKIPHARKLLPPPASRMGISRAMGMQAWYVQGCGVLARMLRIRARARRASCYRTMYYTFVVDIAQSMNHNDYMHTLYRHIDDTGRLLYVGCTSMPLVRVMTHLYGSEWARRIVRIDLEHFDTKAEALAAEQHAARTEAPLYNRRLLKAQIRPQRQSRVSADDILSEITSG